MVHSRVRSLARRIAPLAMGAMTFGAAAASAPPVAAGVVFHPAFSDIQFVRAGEVPPTQPDCNAIGRRCFNPTAEQNSYNLTPILSSGHQGQGQTIIIVDAFGSETMRHDLRVFNNAFGLPHMCGEEGTTAGCTGPTFSELQQGNTSTNPPPSSSKSPGQENRSAWAIEVALDVEWSHSMAPMANILLVTTPTAETLGVQGFPDFFKAEANVIARHRGSVISQSFASTEEAFNGGTAALQSLRFAFQAAQANHVTVFGSSGDFGSAGVLIYITNPGYSTNVNNTGWYVIGGTSSSSPQWAGLIAVANEMNGGKQLGYINPALYALASNPSTYAADFYDVTTGNNGAFNPPVAGYNATTGWDPVTGLGTPNAANLLPDLIAYVNSH